MAADPDTVATERSLTEVDQTDPALLDELAALTRDTFKAGDMLPGLPEADGARDTATQIGEDLDAGVRLWLLRASDGRPIGCIRAIPRSGSVWQIRRLAVARGEQRTGLGRRLVRGLEQVARTEGVRTLVVWALVERGIAPLYSRLGYHTTGHFGSPDKPLSEAIMELDLDQPAPPLAYPWSTEARCPHRQGVIVSWFGSAGRTMAMAGTLTEDARTVIARHQAFATRVLGPVRFVGGDGWADCPPGAAVAVRDILAARADTVAGDGLLFERPCTEVVEFTMPRTVAPDLLALWRLPLSS